MIQYNVKQWQINYAKKYGIRRLLQGEKTKDGDIGYIQPGAKKFKPIVGIKYDTGSMHPIYRKIAKEDVKNFYDKIYDKKGKNNVKKK